MNATKYISERLVSKLPLYLRLQIYSMHGQRKFFSRVKPRRFSDKINLRKLSWRNYLFPVYADKLEVKNIATKNATRVAAASVFSVHESITPRVLRKTVLDHGSIFAKCNHNSGPVFFLNDRSTDLDFDQASKSLNQQKVKVYGCLKGESWYQAIHRKIFLEESLASSKENVPIDYKVHVFQNSVPNFVIQVDFDRFRNHNRTLYNEKGEVLNFQLKFRNLFRPFPNPALLCDLLESAYRLSEPFSYARVDFYETGGQLYIGEITFAPGSGTERFCPIEYDYWMGLLWMGDPRY